jgi:hypothetical protein
MGLHQAGRGGRVELKRIKPKGRKKDIKKEESGE